MAMNHQEFAYTEPTPDEGLAKYLQLFTRGPDMYDFVMRGRDGNMITITLPKDNLAELQRAIWDILNP